MKCISKAWQNSSIDGQIHVLSFRKHFVMHQTLRVKEFYQHYLDFWLNLPCFCQLRWQQHNSIFHSDDICFVSESEPQTLVSPPAIILGKKMASILACCSSLQHAVVHCWILSWREKHTCSVDHHTYSWVNLPSTPLVCAISRCCKILHGFYFNTISSFSINISVPHTFNQSL